MGSLLASLKQNGVNCTGHSFAVNDSNFSVAASMSEVIAQEALRSQDTYIGFSTYVWNDFQVKESIKLLRTKYGFQGKIVLGGPQVSYAGQGTLEDLYPEADIFVRGFGENALSSILHNSGSTSGVHYRGQKDACTQSRVSLDTLPSVLFSNMLTILFSFTTHSLRCLSVSMKTDVAFASIAKLESICSAGPCLKGELSCRNKVRDIAVLDPIFNSGPLYLNILRAFVDQGFQGRLSLQCRFEMMTPEFLELCSQLNVRLEFGLQTIHRSEMLAINRANNMNKVQASINDLLKRNIMFEVSIIYGLPCQTLHSFQQTVDFCLTRKVPVIKAFPLMLLRGTDLERQRHTWDLDENDDIIPAVISSSTFSYSDWLQMKNLAELLVQTEGRHPESTCDLLQHQM